MMLLSALRIVSANPLEDDDEEDAGEPLLLPRRMVLCPGNTMRVRPIAPSLGESAAAADASPPMLPGRIMRHCALIGQKVVTFNRMTSSSSSSSCIEGCILMYVCRT